MDLVYQWFQNNLDIVYFIYGFSFVVMGLGILFQPKQGSEFKIAKIIWFLALFGITHGTAEWLDMWAIIKGGSPVFDKVRWGILLISYLFLFEFSMRLFNIKRKIKIFVWSLIFIILSFILIMTLTFFDFWKTATILTRYLIGFPGLFLTGFGFFYYYQYKKEIQLKTLNVKKYFFLASFAFCSYALLSGTVVPKGDFFPSNLLNTESFIAAVHIPVQVFRTLCAVISAWGIVGILKIFEWETIGKLKDAHLKLRERLTETEKRYEDIIDNSSDIIHSVDGNGFVVFTNKRACELLGYSRDKLVGKHVRDIYATETWEDMGKGFKKLKEEGSNFIENGKMVKENGERIDVEISSVAIYDGKGKFLRTRSIIRDVTKRKRAENALRKSEKMLLEITTQVPGVVYQFYARPNGEMGLYYVSGKSESMVGLKPDLEGFFERFTALVIPEHRDGFIKSVEKSVKELSEWKYEGMLQKPSGEKIWFSGNSLPTSREKETVFNGIVLDITDRKKLEDELKAKVEELEKFHEVTVTRKLEMANLENELEKLKKELKK